MEAVKKTLEKVGPGATVKVGFMEGTMSGWNGPRPLAGKAETAKRANAQPRQVPAAQVAFWQEYGTTSGTVSFAFEGGENTTEMNHIPPRPFFRTMIDQQSGTWGKLMAAALKLNNLDSKKALALMGLKIGEQLQQSINTFSGVPLAQSTIDRKGFDKPLIDSHNMIRAVEFVVDEGARAFVNKEA
jgi:hypothetical protein